MLSVDGIHTGGMVKISSRVLKPERKVQIRGAIFTRVSTIASKKRASFFRRLLMYIALFPPDEPIQDSGHQRRHDQGDHCSRRSIAYIKELEHLPIGIH